MRKVKLFIASSLDGFISRTDGGIDWLFHDQDYGYAAFFGSIDTVVVGRKTYDQALTFEAEPFAGKAVYVFSRSRAGRAEGRVRYVAGDAAAIVQPFLGEAGKDIWLVGGGEVTRAFLAAGLVDEVIVSIHPILIGEGIPLFPPGSGAATLRLRDCTRFDTGLVQLSYDVTHPSDGRTAGSSTEDILRRKRVASIDAFGSIAFDPAYDHKQARRRR